MKKLFAEFKEFIARGNVMDMAIGVIIATAFGKITTSLVNDVFMPFLGWIFGARDMTALNVVVRPAEVDAAGEVVKEAITIGFGTFVGTIIDFILVALVVFAVVKALNKMKKKEEAPAEPEPEKPDPQLELLTEIRDLLKK
ncbi:MAG: large-conductance mechanosensitive channel protein MscL [Clostridia bacterium]|nr:large-conductance mechanosensitive channel protein MscL [Clostridia bacterium]